MPQGPSNKRNKASASSLKKRKGAPAKNLKKRGDFFDPKATRTLHREIEEKIASKAMRVEGAKFKLRELTSASRDRIKAENDETDRKKAKQRKSKLDGLENSLAKAKKRLMDLDGGGGGARGRTFTRESRRRVTTTTSPAVVTPPPPWAEAQKREGLWGFSAQVTPNAISLHQLYICMCVYISSNTIVGGRWVCEIERGVDSFRQSPRADIPFTVITAPACAEAACC